MDGLVALSFHVSEVRTRHQSPLLSQSLDGFTPSYGKSRVTFTPKPLPGPPGMGKGLMTGDKAQPYPRDLDPGRTWGTLGTLLVERLPHLWEVGGKSWGTVGVSLAGEAPESMCRKVWRIEVKMLEKGAGHQEKHGL